MSSPIIPNGTKFGKLEVEQYIGRIHGRRKYKCKCECGKYKDVFGVYLNRNQTKSCGCLKDRTRTKDLTGMRFGRLLVISRDLSKKHPVKWNCKCDCGNTISVLAQSLNLGKSSSCKCLHKEMVKLWRKPLMYKEIPFAYISKLKKQALARGFEFTITIQDVWEIYTKQNKCCFFTKQPIAFYDEKSSAGVRTSSASVDRIDSDKGYTKENCCIVMKQINFMKQDFSVEQFVKYCKLVIDNFNNTQENTNEQTLDSCAVISS